MKPVLKIVVAEPSLIIRKGLLSVLKKISTLNIETTEVPDMQQLTATLSWHRPDVLIVNPALAGVASVVQIKKGLGGAMLKCVALQHSLVDVSVLKMYDEVISVYDTAEQIKAKFDKLIHADSEKTERQEPLTEREKEIIIGVVKGMTNKQIADKLCLSTHTVITHRRNIAGKLQIHSPAGLTIYAIVNKFVDINDIKDSIYNREE
ncbi:MAG TPA: LuxR C-terminal-related transcriptional regulator [Candidatus Barnesiella excrementigallinarum]|nr:LuxR C-terminal-related transcriptional regulator [Candidatus Barnesiella excrementigallinarum]